MSAGRRARARRSAGPGFWATTSLHRYALEDARRRRERPRGLALDASHLGVDVGDHATVAIHARGRQLPEAGEANVGLGGARDGEQAHQAGEHRRLVAGRDDREQRSDRARVAAARHRRCATATYAPMHATAARTPRVEHAPERGTMRQCADLLRIAAVETINARLPMRFRIDGMLQHFNRGAPGDELGRQRAEVWSRIKIAFRRG